MGDIYNYLDNINVDKVIFNCGIFNELEFTIQQREVGGFNVKESFKYFDKATVPYAELTANIAHGHSRNRNKKCGV